MLASRGSVLLSRKAKLLNEWYEMREGSGLFGVEMPTEVAGMMQLQRIRWKVKADEERENLIKMIGISCYRPFRETSYASTITSHNNYAPDLLLTEPVVFFFSLWVAFSWAVLYLTFSSIPLVYQTNHHFNIEQSGAVFAGKSNGDCAGSSTC